MHITEAGLNIIKSNEGCVLTSYWDATGGVWTIGWGHTNGVFDNETITQSQADAFLQSDCMTAENSIDQNVKVGLTQNQFDALVSLIYNIGTGGFSSSTLLQMINASNFAGAADQFSRFVYSGGVVLQGLVTRRAAERALFMTSGGAAVVPTTPSNGIDSSVRALQIFLNAIGSRDNYGRELIIDGVLGVSTVQSRQNCKKTVQTILS